MKRHIQEFPMDFQLRTSFDNPSQPNIKEYKHVKFPSLIMYYIKKGQGINGEIPKDGQQQTLCTHRRALYSCQSKHIADKLGLKISTHS